jgi:hypothetical protein
VLQPFPEESKDLFLELIGDMRMRKSRILGRRGVLWNASWLEGGEFVVWRGEKGQNLEVRTKFDGDVEKNI